MPSGFVASEAPAAAVLTSKNSRRDQVRFFVVPPWCAHSRLSRYPTPGSVTRNAGRVASRSSLGPAPASPKFLKRNGQRSRALAVPDYESRALALSYGGGPPKLAMVRALRYCAAAIPPRLVANNHATRLERRRLKERQPSPAFSRRRPLGTSFMKLGPSKQPSTVTRFHMMSLVMINCPSSPWGVFDASPYDRDERWPTISTPRAPPAATLE